MYIVKSEKREFILARADEIDRYAGLRQESFVDTWGGYLLWQQYDIFRWAADAAGYDSGKWDAAVPQSWFDAYVEKHGARPQAIWVYQEGKMTTWNPKSGAFDGDPRPVSPIFGSPIEVSQVYREFGRWAAAKITNGKAEFRAYRG